MVGLELGDIMIYTVRLSEFVSHQRFCHTVYCLWVYQTIAGNVADQRAEQSTLIHQAFNLLDYLKTDIPVWLFYP